MLVFSVAICCGLYPLVLYGSARVLAPTTAAGGLIDEKGNDTRDPAAARGARLIAQPFSSDEYFWPRPSAASYNATASGGSNLGANNPKLRDRVAQQLGTMVVYKSGSPSAAGGRTPQQDIEAWFAAKPDRVADWASDSSVAPPAWAKIDFANDKYGIQGDYITQWAKDHPDVIEEWKKANADKTDEPKPEDLVVQFFASFAKTHPAKWPGVVETKKADGTVTKKIEPVTSDAQIQSNFFDLWLSDPAYKTKAADLEPVPADMVTASGSGLDPDITVRNALSVYQLDRVAAKRTASPGEAEKIKHGITFLVRSHSYVPLSGLVGEPLVNVLELNLALDAKFPVPPPAPTPAPGK
ncbi:potassium-transporting ATPase subunit C [Fimbriiglobus ruber]|uniref:Potassium-transporting ATPase C chain n=1 Tax=Fimbriiglobus ruber TaxID=1908690 RepID=A0A225E8I5_9BACT|nr:Potassium-transporting ATPase C chain [Fimbriiglobus ruber]